MPRPLSYLEHSRRLPLYERLAFADRLMGQSQLIVTRLRYQLLDFKDAPRVSGGDAVSAQDAVMALNRLWDYPRSIDFDEVSRRLLTDSVYEGNLVLDSATTNSGRVPLTRRFDEAVAVDRGLRSWFPRGLKTERAEEVKDFLQVVGDDCYDTLAKLKQRIYFCPVTASIVAGVAQGALMEGSNFLVSGGLALAIVTTHLGRLIPNKTRYQELRKRAAYVDEVIERVLPLQDRLSRPEHVGVA